MPKARFGTGEKIEIMTKDTAPFAVPASIEPKLARVRSYWEGLLRGDNKVPFWDDIKLSSLADLAEDAMMLDAFDDPLRFRFRDYR
jgi:hypothetical protein